MPDTRQRFFISYAGPDGVWAEWVGWQLKQAGHQVELDRWDWRTGDDFVQKMSQALARADGVLALFSENYFAAGRWTQEEWSAVVATRGRLVPIVIEPLADDDVPDLLAGRLRAEMHGLDETAAVARLLEAVHGPVPPTGPVAFPGAAPADADTEADPQRPRLPDGATLPQVWNVRRRNPDFSGRETELARLRSGLLRGHQAVVQALHGMGGIGKTQIALEYAHRFASQYDVVWWVDAEQADRLPVSYAGLAEHLGIAKADAGTEANARALLQALLARHRWLLILDNAEQPDHIEPWLPDGPGHVLITSRDPDWRGIAHRSGLDVFTRADSLAYLQTRSPGITAEQADLLAQDLGDLPLALAQAAGVLSGGMSLDHYRRLLTTNTARLLRESDVRDYPVSLAATVDIAVTRLLDDGHRDATALLRLGAFLGPEPIPTAWLEASRPHLAGIPGDPDDPMWLRSALQPLSRFGLARTDVNVFQIHRLTQAVLRAQTGPDAVESIRDDVTAVLAAVSPGDPQSPADWPAWATLTAHLTAPHVITGVTGRSALRPTLSETVHFLIRRGLPGAAHSLGTTLYETWTADLGPDHPDTLTCAQFLGHASIDRGDHVAARPLVEDTYARRRRILGEDHLDTLSSAHDVATTLSYLGRYEEARRRGEDVLARRQRVLGEGHPETLRSAGNFAGYLRDAGEYAEARRRGTDVLARRRQILGEDHPDTLESASDLINTMLVAGEHTGLRPMAEDLLARRLRILGEEHPDTISASSSLAGALYALEEYEEALSMEKENVRRCRRVLGENHPNTLTAVGNLSQTLYRLGETAEARRMAEDSLARRKWLMGENHPDTLSSAHGLANILHSQGEEAEACRLQKEVLAKRRLILGGDHPLTLNSAALLTSILYARHEYLEAVEVLGDLRARRIRVLGRTHPETVEATRSLATLLAAMGKTHEAQKLTSRKPNKSKRRSGKKRR
ncbi:FxSxx-COOH system tetratricopeptide repeat protein [Streptomyces sp. NPDC048182]